MKLVQNGAGDGITYENPQQKTAKTIFLKKYQLLVENMTSLDLNSS